MKLLAFLLLALGTGAQAATTTFAATTKGLFKTADGGATWQPVNVTVSGALLQGIPDVSVVAIDPLNSANVYFFGSVVGTSAFFKSTDGGATWSAVLIPGLQAGNTNSNAWLCIDPLVTSTLYISATKTWRSTDSGATWTEMTVLNTIGGLVGIVGIAVDPNNSGVLYASTHQRLIAKSTDFGTTWTTHTSPAFNSSPTIGGIYVDPRNSQRLYLARKSGQGCPTDCAMFKSVDAGQTWQIVPVPGSVRSIDFDKSNGDIYAGGYQSGLGGAIILKSSDQGTTWTPLVKQVGGINDGPAVSVDPGAAGNVYSLGDTIGGGGSLKKTTDGGATWNKVTVPPLCTVIGTSTPACPSGIANVVPQVYALAYVAPASAPPPPPAGSAITTVSAASQQGGPVAAESIVIATGSHLATGAASGDLDQPPTMLAGTTIDVTDSAGVSRPAVLFSVSATQVTYQIPPGTAAGAATVTITAGDGVVGSAQVQVAAVAPGLYTLNGAGLAKAYALRLSNGNQIIEDVYDIDATGAVIARPITISNGDQVYLLVYGTGFRAAGGDIGAKVGGIDAPILFAGPQGVQPGLDQFNILLPPALAAGGPQVVPIVLTAAGQTANTVSVTVQ